ncbi:MAG TPA: DnaJ domain-containing protein [Chthoniobacterales bacterium]|nr:DnaJ domain-containing protein [Chthoniobacterales bacterium]
MIDYFALLDQPKAAWLDLEKLRDTYHEKTLQAHPDAQTNRSAADPADATFANLNEAYQVLQDPKRRLHHLLSLEGATPPSTGQAVPEQLHDLFPQIAGLTQRTDRLLEKLQAASNALSRSLLKPQILEMQQETKEVREKIQNLSDASLEQLRQTNAAWTRSPAAQLERLSNLYFAFAYLSRWSAQLDEITFQLSLH